MLPMDRHALSALAMTGKVLQHLPRHCEEGEARRGNPCPIQSTLCKDRSPHAFGARDNGLKRTRINLVIARRAKPDAAIHPIFKAHFSKMQRHALSALAMTPEKDQNKSCHCEEGEARRGNPCLHIQDNTSMDRHGAARLAMMAQIVK